MDDLDILRDLNRDYIDSVQKSDVRRFDEILAPEFYCSNPDGSLIDRAAFLKQTAQPVRIAGLAAHDVMIRLIGDVAIIHALLGVRLLLLYFCSCSQGGAGVRRHRGAKV